MLRAHRLVAEVPLGFSRAEQLRRRSNITSFSFRATRRGARQARSPRQGGETESLLGNDSLAAALSGTRTVRSRLN
jgi:hypothetical protein